MRSSREIGRCPACAAAAGRPVWRCTSGERRERREARERALAALPLGAVAIWRVRAGHGVGNVTVPAIVVEHTPQGYVQIVALLDEASMRTCAARTRRERLTAASPQPDPQANPWRALLAVATTQNPALAQALVVGPQAAPITNTQMTSGEEPRREG